MVRRTIAAGAILLIVILLVVAFRGCLDARKESAIKDYVSESGELAQQSALQGDSLFTDLLSEPGDQGQAIDRTNAVNALRVESATLVDRANDLDVPDETSDAQRYLVEALELRRDALAQVADALPGALADQERRESTNAISSVMQAFLASDVLVTGRYLPILRRDVADEDLEGEVTFPRQGKLDFVPDIKWVDPTFVADQIEGIRTGEGADGTATPGLHGNGLGTVSLGGVALVPGGSATVTLSDDLAFDVQVVNQGENNETDVTVRATVGRGDDATEVEDTIDTIAVGEQKTVTIPLGTQPPTGQNVPIKVVVEPVAGEEKTDNNEADFTVIFTS